MSLDKMDVLHCLHRKHMDRTCCGRLVVEWNVLPFDIADCSLSFSNLSPSSLASRLMRSQGESAVPFWLYKQSVNLRSSRSFS